jgi:dimethylglycine dehydrogenase
VRKSLALAYVDTDVVAANPALIVYVVGDERAGRILPEPPYDPKGNRLRDLAPVA